MYIQHEGIDIYCLPDNSRCLADEDKRSPNKLFDCPLGRDICKPYECEKYEEE